MIHADTLSFLSELADNNTRDWFNENRKRYDAAKKNVTETLDQLLEGLSQMDEGLLGLTAKDCMFRIFRDTRFSKNKAPYKTNLGGWMARDGRKSPFAGYYLHVEPGGKSFLAGGVYHPQGEVLRSIREAIDYDGELMREIIGSKDFKEQFGEMGGSKVKTSPKGYSKDHPDIDLLRHKGFLMSVNVSDEYLTSEDFVSKALEVYHDMTPLNNYLNRAITEVVEPE